MFYSAIIGSIPGQTKVALGVVNTFVAHLRAKHANLLIINPAEHFVEGMDGDDLMYMWERVQRSGFIDVWRFQSVADIETSFELMGEGGAGGMARQGFDLLHRLHQGDEHRPRHAAEAH